MRWIPIGIVLLWCSVTCVQAGAVNILMTVFTQRGDGWHVSATLRHDDTGWEQYADAWRVVTEAGDVLGTRVLYHPHENEQPFTRSLGGVAIPADTHVVYVQAHCKVHGWSKQQVRVDLRQKTGDHFRVNR